MTRVLFVTNGHGEIAIADRIARELHLIVPEIALEHLALVGEISTRSARDVGPRRRMPSGGLVAMGNVPNIVRDVRAGLAGLTLEQWRFLRGARGRYAAVVATGDAFALWMALSARAPVVYVGTAKSVRVAPYGRGERSVLRRARAIFVRDEETARDLQQYGLHARAPGNVIADLFSTGDGAEFDAAAGGFGVVVAILPGSRERAYADAAFLTDVLTAAARRRPALGGVLSLAPGIDVQRMAAALCAHEIVMLPQPPVPFEVRVDGRVVMRAWSGELGALFARSDLALGQAGTANEAAAAAGLPVLAVELGTRRELDWYRKRQTKLLGDALLMLAPDVHAAAARLGTIVDDAAERERRGAIGRERMGPPGGARRIAESIAQIAGAA